MSKNTLKSWLPSLSLNKSQDDTATRLRTYVHPCVINNQAHIVYPRGLKEDAPQIFKQLSRYFSNMGYKLKEDQRHKTDNNSRLFKRRSWAPIILFTAGLIFESSAQADIEINISDSLSINQQKVELQLISNSGVLSNIRHQLDSSSIEIKSNSMESKQHTASILFGILKKHYQKNQLDPTYISSDFKKIANYFSHYPEVVSLFNAIKDKNWTLVFDQDNWSTIASGNLFEIERAEVHINTRSAAQLRLNDSCKDNPVCIASPADALLHELLHVHSMFNETEKFMAQGGMNNVLYPYQHERSIIKKERELYKNMSKKDGIKRPSRHSHAGRIVKANCSTCIK
jgi:hypothetical protein